MAITSRCTESLFATGYFRTAVLWLACLCVLLLLSEPVIAQQPPPPAPPQPAVAPACEVGAPNFEVEGSAFLNRVLNTINDVLVNAVEGVYAHITADFDFRRAVDALVALYIAIYGAMILFQLTPAKPGEVVIRLVKIGLLYAIIGPGGWLFFTTHVRAFFIGGMNDIITVFNNIALGTFTLSPGPVGVADVTTIMASPIGVFISSRMLHTIEAMLFTGYFGFILTILVLWSLGIFLYSVMAALGTYIKSLVGLYFLFALAPIFFAFLLFQRTRSLFDGWVNQLLNFTLQPIFVFSFLGFFFAIIMAAMQGILEVPVCLLEYTTLDFKIDTLVIEWWRFAVPGTGSSAPAYQIYNGDWGFCGPEEFCGNTVGSCGNCGYDVFPVDITNILMLFISSALAFEYADHAGAVAKKISGGQADAAVRGADVRGWFNKNNLTPVAPVRGAAKAAGRGVGRGGRWAWNKVAGKNKGPEGDTVRRPGVGGNAKGDGANKTGGNTGSSTSGAGSNKNESFKTPPGAGGGKR